MTCFGIVFLHTVCWAIWEPVNVEVSIIQLRMTSLHYSFGNIILSIFSPLFVNLLMNRYGSPWIELLLFLSFLPFWPSFSLLLGNKVILQKFYGLLHFFFEVWNKNIFPQELFIIPMFPFLSILLVFHQCNKFSYCSEDINCRFFFWSFPLLPALSLFHWVPFHCWFLLVYLFHWLVGFFGVSSSVSCGKASSNIQLSWIVPFF